MPQITRNFPQKSGYTCFLLYKDVGNGQTLWGEDKGEGYKYCRLQFADCGLKLKTFPIYGLQFTI